VLLLAKNVLVSGECRQLDSEALLVSGEWRVKSGTDFSIWFLNLLGRWWFGERGKGKGERVKQKRGRVEARDVDRGKGKAENGNCFSFKQKSWNRTGFHVFYKLTRFYARLTGFDRFYTFCAFWLVKSYDFTSQNSFLTTLIGREDEGADGFVSLIWWRKNDGWLEGGCRLQSVMRLVIDDHEFVSWNENRSHDVGSDWQFVS